MLLELLHLKRSPAARRSGVEVNYDLKIWVKYNPYGSLMTTDPGRRKTLSARHPIRIYIRAHDAEGREAKCCVARRCCRSLWVLGGEFATLTRRADLIRVPVTPRIVRMRFSLPGSRDSFTIRCSSGQRRSVRSIAEAAASQSGAISRGALACRSFALRGAELVASGDGLK
jgi:hypothetical protein